MAARGRKTGFVFILLALILMVILGAGAYMFKDVLFPQLAPVTPNQQATPESPVVKTVDIVVLTQNVSFGQQIPDSALGFAPIPIDRYVEGLYFKTKDQIKGRTARYQLQSGTILTTGMLSASPLGSYASSQIPAGYVAISVPISQLTSVSYALQPGDHVSILVALLLEELDPAFQSELPNTTAKVEAPGTTGGDKTNPTGPTTSTITITGGATGATQGRTELDPVLNKPVYVQPSEPQRPRVVTQVLVSDAIVLGVGRFPKDATSSDVTSTQPTPQAAQTTPTVTPVTDSTGTADPEMITLVVTPQDAVTINYVMLNRGAMMNLVLRSSLDNKTVKTEAVTLQFLMDQYNIPFPSKLPYGLEPRVDELNYYVYPQMKPTPTTGQ